MKKILRWVLKALLVIPFLILIVTYNHKTENAWALPGSFVKTKIVEGFNSPTDFTFTPDGRILVLEKGGLIKVIKDGQIQSQNYIQLPVNSDGERGLLGIALDPQFTSNRYVYLYYINNSPLEIRLSRFIQNGSILDPGSETILLKSTQPLGLLHHSGTIRFGSDGKLWITVGNNGITANSQDLSNIHGKILRINKDGTIPQDNPFVATSTASKSIWAYGLRNPFRFSFLPDGNPIIGDVGDENYEEVNIGVKGGNFGYPYFEGSCSSCPYVNPAYAYSHGEDSASITGGFLYQEELFPEEYHHNYFYGDYSKGFIKRLDMHEDGSFDHEEVFDENAGTVVEFLPDGLGNFYFLTIFPGSLYKVSYSTDNNPPTAKISADKTFGPLPLTVNFLSLGSEDPENKPLKYFWDFGDGVTSQNANPQHKYQTPGKYTATLIVNDGVLDSQEVSLDIFPGNNSPDINLINPIVGQKYNAGEIINFSANASDTEDGALPNSAFSWNIIFHHGPSHIHPFLGPINGVKSGQFTIPNTGEPAADTWYEIKLTVTDSLGLKKVISREVRPNRINLTIDSSTPGMQITVDGIPQTTPISFEAVVGFKRTLDTQTPQIKDGVSYDFQSWSDNGKKSHEIVTPSINTTYTANFKSAGTGSGHLRFRVQEFVGENWTGKFLNGATVKLTDISGNTVLGIQTSAPKGSEDGWVNFNNIPVGTYGILSYRSGYEGAWKQADCQTPGGSFKNATITNINTEGMKAAWDNNAPITTNQVTVCQDLGLRAVTKGNLYFKIAEVLKVGNKFQTIDQINDVTVKLTDPSGENVINTIKSVKASNGEDGWVFFNGVEAGNYGILAYKAGFNGVTKMVNCLISDTPSTIQNQNTEGQIAAWDNSVTVNGGQTTTCKDLVLTDPSKKAGGSLRFRIPEFNEENHTTGNFINGATVKLTDKTGVRVFETRSSDMINGENGWVHFNNIQPGVYGILAYKAGYEGFWKQVDCQVRGSFDGVVLDNLNTEGLKAAFDNNAEILEDKITVCEDLGLKPISNIKTGNLRFRIREIEKKETKKYLNGITVKLTDIKGEEVFKVATSSSQLVEGQDGWVWFDKTPVGTYGVMAYKEGFKGVWKQVDCQTEKGSTKKAKIKNKNSDNLAAAWDDKVDILEKQYTVCQDLGLKATGKNDEESIEDLDFEPENEELKTSPKTEEATESGDISALTATESAQLKPSSSPSPKPSPSPEQAVLPKEENIATSSTETNSEN